MLWIFLPADFVTSRSLRDLHKAGLAGVIRQTRCRRRHHVFDARAGNSGNQSSTALKRNVVPAPVDCDRQTIAEANQEIDVGQAP